MRALAIIVMLASTLLAAGCGSDYYAKQIVQPDVSNGRMCEGLVGDWQKLLEQKRIDVARVIPGEDKTPIDVWVIHSRQPAANPKPVIQTAVLLHGLGESKANYLAVGEKLARKGYEVVLMDLRTHGRSGGKYVTYGAKEKFDVKAVIDALIADKTIPDSKLVVFGNTLGACTAIQYAAIEPRVGAVMSIDTYADCRTIARRVVFFNAPTMSDSDFEAVMKRVGSIAEFNPADASAVVAARKITCPMLLVYGMLNLIVPQEHSGKVFDAAGGPKKMLPVLPGPEQVALLLIWDDWLADQIDKVARGNIGGTSTTTTQPTTQPTTGEAASTLQPIDAITTTATPLASVFFGVIAASASASIHAHAVTQGDAAVRESDEIMRKIEQLRAKSEADAEEAEKTLAELEAQRAELQTELQRLRIDASVPATQP